MGVFVHTDGFVCVADYFAGQVKRLAKNGTEWVTVAGQNNELDLVRGVCVDKDGNVYCTQYGYYFNGHVKLDGMVLRYTHDSPNWKIVAGGNGVGTALNQFAQPTSVMLDAAGNIYVADSHNDHGLDNARVVKWARGATEGTIAAGGNGAGNNDNQSPFSFHAFVNKDKVVYVSNWSPYNKVTKWRPGAAEGKIAAGGNGEGSAANQFNTPGGIFVRERHLYVAGLGNNRIQRFDLSDDNNTASFVARHPGTYTATVSYEDGSTAISNSITIKACNQVAATGVNVQNSTNKIESNKVFTYPVPASSNVNIQFVAQKNGMHLIEITAAGGNILLHKTAQATAGANSIAIDISSLASGIYFARIISANGQKTVTRFEKQ